MDYCINHVVGWSFAQTKKGLSIVLERRGLIVLALEAGIHGASFILQASFIQIVPLISAIC